MKLIGSTAIAMALAATTAFAQSDSNEEMENSNDTTQVESSGEASMSDSNSDSGDSMAEDSDSPMTYSGMDWDKSSQEMQQMQGELIRSRDITGGAVYTTNEAHDEGEGWDMTTYDEVDSDWNQIGEIEDLVMSQDGKLTGIVVEVGGFLDIGDKHVVLSVKDAKLVPVDNMSYTFVTRFNEEDLEAMNGVDEAFWN